MVVIRPGTVILNSEEELEEIKEDKKLEGEESAYKFYYCESEDKYYIGHRCDNFYYADVMVYPNGEVVLHYFRSRWLPWGRTLNGHTFPTEPKEISAQEYITWFLKALEENKPVDRAVTLS